MNHPLHDDWLDGPQWLARIPPAPAPARPRPRRRSDAAPIDWRPAIAMLTCLVFLVAVVFPSIRFEVIQPAIVLLFAWTFRQRAFVGPWSLPEPTRRH